MGFQVNVEKDEQVELILARDLEQGKLAEIVEWPHDNYLGSIVIRSDRYLFGLRTGQYGLVWSNADEIPDTCKVRILEPGVKIILENV